MAPKFASRIWNKNVIIFLYGEDNFRSLQKLKKIISRYQGIHKSGLNLKFFDFKKDEFEDFRDRFQTKSMFKEKGLFVLKNAFSNPQFKKRFLKQKGEFLQSQNIILFYEDKRASEKDPFFIFLKEKSASQRFDPLETKRLEEWIKRELTEYKAEIEPGAKKLLIQYAGNNLWQLSNEIKKLANYKWDPKGAKITEKDVEMLTPQKTELNIFRTIGFIAKKQRQKALFLIRKHLEKGDSPLYLLAMINFQFRNLLVIKEMDLSGKNISSKAKKLGLHPFVVKKGLELSQKFTLGELKKIYQKIFQIDLDIKSGRIDPESALDLLIAEI